MRRRLQFLFEFAAVPSELVDRPFERFVDLKLLGEAYLTRDAGLMTDVALQLLEGERVLLRSHKGVKVSTVVDAAIDVATDSHDVATLDRLGKVAEKLSDATIGERVNAARQLASQTRADEPVPPLPSEEMTHEELAEINDQMQVYERAKAIGDVASLKKLQEELKDRAAEEGSLPAFLAKQVADALAELPESGADAKAPESVELLNKLAGPARGLDPNLAVYLEQTATGAFVVGGRAFQRDGKGKIYFHDTKAPAEYGENEWTPERAPTAVKLRYGLANVMTNWVKGSDGNWYQAWDPNPDFAVKATLNAATGNWDSVWTQTFAAPVFNLPAANGKNVNAIIAYDPLAVDFAAMVAAGGGNFTYQEIASLKGGAQMTFAQLVAAGGGNIVPPDTRVPQAIREKAARMPGGFNLANVVKAGGGSITIGQISRTTSNFKIDNVSNMVAAGGGNLQERLVNVRDVIAAGNFLNHVVNPSPDYKAIINANQIATLLPGKSGTLVGNDGASGPANYSLQGTGHFSGAKKLSAR